MKCVPRTENATHLKLLKKCRIRKFPNLNHLMSMKNSDGVIFSPRITCKSSENFFSFLLDKPRLLRKIGKAVLYLENLRLWTKDTLDKQQAFWFFDSVFSKF